MEANLKPVRNFPTRPGHLVDESMADAVCDVGDQGRAIIARTEFASQREYNPRRGRRVANVLNDLFEPFHFAGKLILELGPGHYAFALLARHLGAEVICVERDAAFVNLGRYLGFETLDQDFTDLRPDQFSRPVDGLWAKGVFNACRARSDEELAGFVHRVTDLLAPDAWGWFISSNKTKTAPRGSTVEEFIRERVELQREAFVSAGWTACLVPDEQRPRYAMNYANSPYFFVKGLDLAAATVASTPAEWVTEADEPDRQPHDVQEDDSYEEWDGLSEYGEPDDPDPAYPATDATLRFNKAFRAWQPHSLYLDDPWGYFVQFIEIVKSRGARFITMSQAIAGEYDEDEINVLLDHHIDFYPLEMEVMARWELENDVVSTIYLFNRFLTTKSIQKKIWRVEDLDIALYQRLERAGFEIGYHHNAVGTTMYESGRSVVELRSRPLSEEERAHAARIFVEDVTNLRRYFDIRTFIPHGAGEFNTELREVPPGLDDLVWVYNNTRGGAANRPTSLRWRNFSDSSGIRPQVLRAYGARYFAFADKLHVCAHLLTPGLNHVLIHPGRFARGMPYGLLDRPERLNSRLLEQMSFHGVAQSSLPLRPSELLSKWEADSRLLGADSTPTPEAKARSVGGSQKHYVMSDDPGVLRRYLAVSDRCVPFLVHHEMLDAAETKMRKQPVTRVDPSVKRVHLPRARADADQDAAFLEEFRQFINEVFTPDIIKHLAASNLPADVVDIRRARITDDRSLRLLARLLRQWRPESRLHLEATLELPAESWNANIADNEKLVKVLARFDVERSGDLVSVRSRPG